MKIALTGATGFIGKRLIAKLLEGGHQLHTLGRTKPSEARVMHFPWEADKEPPAAAIDGTDAVIHLAGEPVAQRWDDEVKRRIRQSRSAGTRNLVASIARSERPPRVLISASASGYYGDRGEEILTEQSAAGSGFLPSVCVEWEREAARARELGLRVGTVRIGIVLGADGGALKTMLPPFRLGAGGKLGSGKQWIRR